MVNDIVPGSSQAPRKTGIDPLAGTAPWPTYVEQVASEDDDAPSMTPLGPGLNDGELLPGDTPPIENDLPHSEIAAHTRLI